MRVESRRWRRDGSRRRKRRGLAALQNERARASGGLSLRSKRGLRGGGASRV